MSLAPFSNLAYMELLYSRYQRDPQSVPAEWRRYFTETVDEKKNGHGESAEPSFEPRSIFNPAALAAPTGALV
jgi:2-oxoglutarate dehydrogenase complex dehydrogenase (E1) component-like enzyme